MVFCFFHSWLFDLYTHIQHSENVFVYFSALHFIWNIHETTLSNGLETAFSTSNTAPEDKIYDTTKQIENITESPEDQTSGEPKTDPTENTQQNPLQIHDSFYSETWVKKSNCRNQNKVQAANPLLRKQKLEPNNSYNN